MAVYATPSEVTAALAPFPDVPVPDDLGPLLLAACLAVDARLGPYVVHPTSGLKLDGVPLTGAQAAALARATCLAAGYLAQRETEQVFGVDDFLPATLTLQRGAGLAERLDETLSGFGLIARSHTVPPAAEDVLVMVDDDGV